MSCVIFARGAASSSNTPRLMASISRTKSLLIVWVNGWPNVSLTTSRVILEAFW